jgi:ATP-binding cassette, subfamily G (WHITE), eye pigment precursor transporter
MQDDSLIGSLTVFESLDYVARLKLPHLTKDQRRERIDKIIKQLRLWKVRDSLIGTQFRRGISGGEKRRVAIGVELVTSPSILFLDEPTSGLDGASAYTVMKNIIDLGKMGCSIICTIHQPRSNIFSLFDQLLLLSTGQVAYMGPAASAMTYFEQLGCSMSYVSNPADWMCK